MGVWSYSALLTAGATVFFTQPSLRLPSWLDSPFEKCLPPRSLPVHLFAVLVTVVLHSALSPILATFHLPVFTLPFVLTSWVFLLFPTGNDTVTRTLETLTPEQRIFRARKLSKQLTSSRDGATITKENLMSVAEQGEA